MIVSKWEDIWSGLWCNVKVIVEEVERFHMLPSVVASQWMWSKEEGIQNAILVLCCTMPHSTPAPRPVVPCSLTPAPGPEAGNESWRREGKSGQGESR